MGAAIEQDIVKDRERLRVYVKQRFGVDADLAPAKIGTYKSGWLYSKDATSAGPIVWVKSRLSEKGLLPAGCPDEHDDSMFCIKGKRLVISPVARSKMFRTPEIVFPIDLNAFRVAGRPWK